MNMRKIGIVAVAICSLGLGAILVARAATNPVPIGLAAGSSLWLEGTSNLHEFQSRTSQVAVAFTSDPGAAPLTDAASLEAMIRNSAVKGFDVSVPVTTLHSGKSGLDKNLYKALNAEDHPQIRFHLEKYTVTPRANHPDTLNVHAEGTLNVAGKECPVALEAQTFHGDRGVWLEGSEVLLMSTYGIKPPTMMLGTLRVNDKVTIHYRLLLALTGSAAAATSAK